MPGRRGLGALRLAGAWAALAVSLGSSAEASGTFSSVEPAHIMAGSFYAGATLHVRGSIDERSQVAIRVMGPLEHHSFNRRGKIAGIIWGGIEHVTFHHAPSLYAVYTSAALTALAPPPVRDRLQLGYQALAAQMEVLGTGVDKGAMIEQFVRLKESEGLYRLAPGAVRLADAERGRRTFDVAVPLPATAGPGDIGVAVFELADGAVVGEDTESVQLSRVGMPAYLFRLAHERGTLFGVFAVLVLIATGVGVDLLGSWRGARRTHPVVVVLGGLAQVVDDAAASTARHRLRSPEQIGRMHAKYGLFRTLLSLNNELLELLAELEEESSWTFFRHARVRMGIRALFDGTADLVGVLNELTGNRYFDLVNVVATLRADVWKFLEKASEPEDARLTLGMGDIGSRTAGQVGGKAVNLARVECDLGLRVPASFAVTIEAYREFLEVEGLASQLRTILAPARLDAPEEFRRRCEMAQDLVRQAPTPPAVVEAIEGAYRACGFPAEEGLAVRSSAAGEGSELSFAGQFETLLNVPGSGLAEAWKKVVGSRFSPSAVFYRRAAGLAEVDTPMAVLVQRMIRARASGVLFTRRPDEPRGSALLINAVKGLGPHVSAGIASADQLVVSRATPHRVLERHVARKPVRLVEAEGGGLAQLAMEADEQLMPSLTDDEAVRLAGAALAIERYFGAPQDVEWAFDADGQLFILQARPLRADRARPQGEAPGTAPLLLRGGDPVWPGRAVGPVHVARTPEEEERTPIGALLVVPQLLPDCVRLLPRVCGIVVERGTITGHAASVLREFRVPSLFGVAGAVDTLVEGQVVSLDAASRAVFAGAVWPELRGRLPVTVLGRRTVGLPELLAGKLTKLSSSAFVGTWACQSLHDVAIESMFDIGDRLLESPIGGVKKLECPPPIYVHIVDLGGGLRPEAASNRSVTVDQVVSLPFQGLWRGLGDPHFVPQRPQRPGLFWSVIATTMVDSEARELGAPNYACITDSYLNLNSRQAYHFVVVDAFLSGNQNNNHISVRLKGGGAASWQRSLRAEFAAEVLRRHHFTVNVTGDVLNGWIRGVDSAMGADKLAMLGHLLRFLARLDMWMTDERHVKEHVEAFAEAEAAAQAARTVAATT
jgi:pyruvate, water dikinase